MLVSKHTITNFKMNSLQLETKQSELCLYTFKYLNCKDDYQMDSNKCSFWKHQFNKKWHSKNIKKFEKLESNQFVQL